MYDPKHILGGHGYFTDDSFIYKNSYVLSSTSYGPGKDIKSVKRWLKAGPRKHIFFNPKEVKAAIVTCGGLCPGLNNVIREIVLCLN